MILKIKCTECGTEGNLSLTDPVYQGPYRCWKCRALFTIRIENNELKACEPLTEAELQRHEAEAKRQQEIDALKAKFKRQ